jgi:glycosyltransferase involved in cell wall biosynthesis
MAVGMQVVASGRGGSGEYLRDRENCLIAAEPEQIAAAVTRLAGDPELRLSLRSGARETAARYPDSAFADGVEQAAEAVIRG